MACGPIWRALTGRSLLWLFPAAVAGAGALSFVGKAVELLELGVHVLLPDLLHPSRHDPRGLHGAIWNFFDEGPYDLPLAEPLTLASYRAGPAVKVYLEHLAVGGVLIEMPL